MNIGQFGRQFLLITAVTNAGNHIVSTLLDWCRKLSAVFVDRFSKVVECSL